MISGKTTAVDEEEKLVEIDTEFYNVLYTKHLQQKAKVWDDGFLEYHVKSKKLSLFTSSTRC